MTSAPASARVLRPALSALLIGASLLTLGGCAQNPAGTQTAVATEEAAPASATGASAPAATQDKTLLSAGGRREPFESRKAQISYATGVQTARNFARNSVEFDPDMVMAGMRDVQENQPIRMSEKQLSSVMRLVQNEIHRNMVSSRQELKLKNRTRGDEFREQYRQKADVHDINGTVLYRVIKKGDGDVPSPDDMVAVRYRGTLIDGTEFDATEGERGSLMELPQLIQGWQLAMRQMPVGSRWEIVVPPALGYGERGVGTKIGPNETLVFDVELLSIIQR